MDLVVYKHEVIEWLNQNTTELSDRLWNNLTCFSAQHNILLDYVEYVYISFLRSSIIDQYPWFKIDLCGNNAWLDIDHSYFFWDVQEFRNLAEKHRLEQDAYMLNSKKTSQQLLYETFLMEGAEIVHSLMPSVMRTISANIPWNGFKHGKELHIYYGEYLSNYGLIYSKIQEG